MNRRVNCGTHGKPLIAPAGIEVGDDPLPSEHRRHKTLRYGIVLDGGKELFNARKIIKVIWFGAY